MYAITLQWAHVTFTMTLQRGPLQYKDASDSLHNEFVQMVNGSLEYGLLPGLPVALHVSRYICRSRFPQNPGVFQV